MNSDGSFFIDYSPVPDVQKAVLFNEVIFHPDARVNWEPLRKQGTMAIAYLSVTEINPGDKNYLEAKSHAKLLGKNQVWGTELVDVREKEWREYLLRRAKAAWETGFRGFFLDTLDSVELLPEGEFSKELIRESVLGFIKDLRRQFPEAKIVVNRGLNLFDSAREFIDCVLIESVFQSFDPKSGRSLQVDPVESEEIQKWVGVIREADREVWIVDYVPAFNEKLARATAEKIESLGASALITAPSLNGISLAPLRFVSRKILVIYGWREDRGRRPMWPIDTLTANRLQMPLEWLGYECHYHHAANDPLPDDIAGVYAGVIFDAELDIPFEKERDYVNWLIDQRLKGLKILFAGEFPFKQDGTRDVVFRELKIGGTGETLPELEEVFVDVKDKEIMDFEAKVLPRTFGFIDMQAPPKAECLLGIRGRIENRVVGDFDPVFLDDWGGMALDPYMTFEATSNIALSLFDPFAFLSKIWPPGEFPAPDPSTRDGCRVVFSHIDGDGFATLSNLKRNVTCAEIVRDRILKKYPLPVTVSVIEADTRAVDVRLNLDDRERYEEIARDIFRMPNIEPASHTYSHPYSWIKDDPDTEGLYDSRNLELIPEENYPEVDYFREIAGSIRYIEKELLPEGKLCKLLLWSGNCRPSAEAIAICDQLGVENMNGGNTIITSRNPGLASIAPRTMMWPGNTLQIYAPNQNEYVYTNDWRGPLYGGFQSVIETFELTEEPRRLKPVNIYYHFYSASRMGAFRALQKIHDWAMSHPLHAITALDYAKSARDSSCATFVKQAEGHWLVGTAGHIRTFRFPKASGFPDLSRSKGITGWCDKGDQRYIHCDSTPAKSLVLVPEQPFGLRLESSTGNFTFLKRDITQASFLTNDFREVKVSLAGTKPNSKWSVQVNQSAHFVAVADENGKISLDVPGVSEVSLTLTDS